MKYLTLLLFYAVLCATDYDVILVGSSPFSLFEALFQYHSGKTVLILEQANECGGAWKTIDICGVSHVDLGCHQIGNDLKLKEFLEHYAGCRMVCLENPLQPYDPTHKNSSMGYYFSQGCYELIHHLLQLVQATSIEIRLGQKAERVTIDSEQQFVTVQTPERSFSTKKLIVTPTSCLQLGPSKTAMNCSTSKYYHLYLLIQDPIPPCFAYQGNLSQGVSRVMNLTHQVGLTDSGRHMVIIQTHGEQFLTQSQLFLDLLKSQQLISPQAYILKEDTYIYESGYLHSYLIQQLGAQDVIEVLQTGHIANLGNYIPKWSAVLKPYHEVIRN